MKTLSALLALLVYTENILEEEYNPYHLLEFVKAVSRLEAS